MFQSTFTISSYFWDSCPSHQVFGPNFNPDERMMAGVLLRNMHCMGLFFKVTLNILLIAKNEKQPSKVFFTILDFKSRSFTQIWKTTFETIHSNVSCFFNLIGVTNRHSQCRQDFSAAQSDALLLSIPAFNLIQSNPYHSYVWAFKTIFWWSGSDQGRPMQTPWMKVDENG